MVQSHPERWRGLLLAVGAAVAVAGCDAGREAEGVAAATPACDADDGGLLLPEGFCALVVSDHFGTLRHLAVSESGDVYAALLNRRIGLGGVVALRDTDGDGRADLSEQFDSEGGVGLAIHDGHLYLGTDAAVVRYRLGPGQLLPAGPREVVVGGFPAGTLHSSKTFAFDTAGQLYVSVGSFSNACQAEEGVPGSPGREPCPDLETAAGIWRVPVEAAGADYLSAGERYASGIRHALAIDWEPERGALYVVQQGRDDLNTLWPQSYTAEQAALVPGEELLRVEPGTAHGWPYCFYQPELGRLVAAPEYLAAADEAAAQARCAAFPAPALAFPAHSSPADMLFYRASQFPERYRGGLFVALQGGYGEGGSSGGGHQVMFVPFRDGLPAGAPEDFARGFVRAQADAPAYRPGGLAVGPDGSLYVSDSTQGRIWRILHRPSP